MPPRPQRGVRKQPPALRPVPTEVAIDALKRGGVVLAPTESVFGLAVDGRAPGALEGLWAIKGTPPQPLAWHATRLDEVVAHLTGVDHQLSTAQRRIAERLTPGPLLMAIELDAPRVERVRTALGVSPSVVDDGAHLLVRIVEHPTARALISAFQGVIVMGSLPGNSTARDLVAATSVLHEAHVLDRITAAVDGPPSPRGVGSTAVTFRMDGTFEVTREGVYERRFVEKQARQLALFVCSGNTCRSPMAEAIARQLIKDAGALVEVSSAGVFASSGHPATPEAVHAVRALGSPMHRHSSRSITRDMLRSADVIFAMTAAHAEAAARFDPEARARIMLLDPSEHDVEDPIGQPQRVYDETAIRMRSMIEQRMIGLGLLPAPTGGASR